MVSRLASPSSSTPFRPLHSPPLCPGPYRCPPQLSHSFLFSPSSSIFNPLTFRLQFRDHPSGGSRTLLRLVDHQVNRVPPPPPPPAVEAAGRFSSLILASYQHWHRASETEDGLPSTLWLLDCFPKLTEENGDVHWHFPSVTEPSWLSRKISWTSVCVKSAGSFHRRDLRVLCFALRFNYRLKVARSLFRLSWTLKLCRQFSELFKLNMTNLTKTVHTAAALWVIYWCIHKWCFKQMRRIYTYWLYAQKMIQQNTSTKVTVFDAFLCEIWTLLLIKMEMKFSNIVWFKTKTVWKHKSLASL